MKIWVLNVFLLGILVRALDSSALEKAAPIKVDKNTRIAIPKHLRGSGKKLRIRNLTTGKEEILDLADQEFLSSVQVRALTDNTSKILVPEFSILESTKKVERRAPVPRDPLSSSYSKSLAYDQPVWRSLGFSVKRLKSGQTRIEIDPKAQQSTLLSPEEAARRRGLREDTGIRRLFEVGFKALGRKRYDVSLEAFNRILAKDPLLDESQRVQAHFGRGMSAFHQLGCSSIEADFSIADKDPKNFEDISYFRALCLVEAQRFMDAQGLFRDLVRKSSERYAEASRFYLGVVAENREEFDEAEAAYMDTIDFAADKRLVDLSKERLKLVRQLRAEKNYETKWATGLLSSGIGYDSNVVGLPQGVAPSEYNVTSEATSSLTALAALELKPPVGRRIEPKFRYAFLLLHYADGILANSYDIQAHDVALGMNLRYWKRDIFGVGSSYTSVYLGPVATSSEYSATTAFDGKWQRILGPVDSPTGDIETSFKVGLVRPRAATLLPILDNTANSYLLSYRYNLRHIVGHVFGPGVDVEYKPAAGTENTYASLNLVGKWDTTLGPETWGVAVSHEASLMHSNYYQSLGKRTDYVGKYTGSISRLWWGRLETRVQAIFTTSFSSEQEKYKYNKAQANFLVSAFF